MLRAAALLLVLLVGCAGGPRDFGITPLAAPVVTPTIEPPPTASPRPPPTPTRTPLPSLLWVAGAGRDGVVLRSAPGTGERVTGLVDGARLVPMGEEEREAGRLWLRVRDVEGRLGWIAAEFVSATPPATPGSAAGTTTPRPSPTRV